MKKLLSILLALVMVVGVGAAGAVQASANDYVDILLYLTDEENARSFILELMLESDGPITEDETVFFLVMDIWSIFIYDPMVTVEQMISACPDRNWEVIESKLASLPNDASRPYELFWEILNIFWTPYPDEVYKGALKAKLDAAEKRRYDIRYTQASSDALYTAYLNAWAVYIDDDATQTEVDSAAAYLQIAINALEWDTQYIKLWGRVTIYEKTFWNWLYIVLAGWWIEPVMWLIMGNGFR